MINNKILIVDDEPDICNLVSDILSDSGYLVKSAFSKDEAIKIMENSGISLVITDIWMNDNEREGFELPNHIGDGVNNFVFDDRR